MSFKLNNENEYESLTIKMDKENFPKVFENKTRCLQDSGLSREEAEKEAERIMEKGVEMEAYYEVGCGLFLVEPEAVESTDIHSPYSGEVGEHSDKA